ncbi:3'-5' exoribonuclease YhaM family protein [Bradymonas sediminis]|uniref:HD family phosphohydrolase n=1 Tax=Bradymonas sediminis TaxID=1548548 RepID=A0A2Z4FLM3_9DELT|nr:HD domain-containing protein [Bradymonas sediminis]AWV89851.1 HD family phosphohydrolase [Bradymonas sediminis]TDP76400.1 3'-5' exoribonuclease [Bradymonas sediminis]
MSDKIFVEQLVEGETIRSVFLVSDKSVRATKSGKPFLALTLGDKSGSIDAKVWDNAEAIATRFEADDFVAVEAQVDSWQSKLQLNIRDVHKVDDANVAFEDFVPVSRWPREALLEQLKTLVREEVRSPEMQRFFNALFADKELMQRYQSAPAAKGNHHAFLGGLVEHSLSMTRLAVRIGGHYANYYPGLLNTDLLIAGCVLHDIGKCYELSYARSFDYTDEGQLVGHIVQGVEMVTAIAAPLEPALPADMILQIKHLILAHHGKKEYGSPVLPRTPEALVLHEIDMIDSRMAMLANIADQQASDAEDSGWSGYERLFQGRVYMGNAQTPTDAPNTPAMPHELVGPGAQHADAQPQQHAGSAARPAAAKSASAAPANPKRQPAEPAPNLDLFSK